MFKNTNESAIPTLKIANETSAAAATTQPTGMLAYLINKYPDYVKGGEFKFDQREFLEVIYNFMVLN